MKINSWGAWSCSGSVNSSQKTCCFCALGCRWPKEMVVSLIHSTSSPSLLKEWLPKMQGFLLVGGNCSLVLGKCPQVLSYGEFFCGHLLTLWAGTWLYTLLRTKGKYVPLLPLSGKEKPHLLSLSEGIMRSLVSLLR